jgi:60 kDa SS-A/Ro ribonucleoprotein
VSYNLGQLVQTPQSKPMAGTAQVQNSAGGYTWEVDDWTRLHRFLILGADGPTYYAGRDRHALSNLEVVERCLKEDGQRVAAIVRDVSVSGRAPKQDPAIAALAMCVAMGDPDTKRVGWAVLSEVCRTATHLFMLLGHVTQLRGWGRGFRRAVAGWYDDKTVDEVAYQAIKYRNRERWTHRDALRLGHPTKHQALYRWITSGELGDVPSLVAQYVRLQESESPAATAALLRERPDLPREAVPTEHLTDPQVWEALLPQMPMTAMVRNLATMTRVGLIAPGSAAEQTVVDRLADADRITRARIHPIAVLSALVTYSSGRSARGSTSWVPTPRVVDALDGAFYLAFGNLPKTGTRRLIALDVSGSMGWGEIAAVPGLTPRLGAAAVALTTAASGDPFRTIAFTGHGHVTPLPLSARQRLDDVVRMTSSLPFGPTDCSLPMLVATQEKWDIDLFEVYTDNETWAGSIHPAQALRQYRQQSGIDSRLAVVAMVSNGFTIADPLDSGMLDVVGFDTATPDLLAGFAAGQF